ncbi:ABC transporter ATP-binding protein [Stieleria sp. TO1_6]|uniref:ABC transporter ATP-binding protein n=1 Tax=Stieleria tagensis TaxID=2956795 RepID=UPI00209AEB3D|nr:ABC transporter ATP-binding protein [Stieleria tagensis]MCO8124799.1 ABC transporter ATP-binding protein [Stieleria tagensis]
MTDTDDPDCPQPEAIVQLRSLGKRYGSFNALADCSLDIQPGDVFGLLGPNGAGKTTLIRLVMGFLQRTSGSVSVCGYDPQRDSVAVHRQVAYLPGDARLPRHLRGDGVLRFFADIHPLGDLSRSREIAEALELDTRRFVGLMSTGMRQKLALAVVLAPVTPLLILDEPTANLDPSVRATVLELVQQAARAGRTIMLSSHVMSEIEETCNRVCFLRRGKLVRELEMADLFQRHRIWADLPSDERCDVSTITDQIPVELRENVVVTAVDARPSTNVRAIRIDTAGDLAPMLEWIGSLGLQRMRIEPLGLRAIYDSVHRDTLPDPRSLPIADSRADVAPNPSGVTA